MDKVQLLDDLSGGFSQAELKELCLRLGLDYEDIAGETRRSKALALIGYMERRGQLLELVQVMVNARPNLAAKYNVAAQPAPLSTSPSDTSPKETSENVAPPSVIEQNAVMVNPYVAGRMVTDEAMFFGREQERRRLRARLQNRGSSSIVGMRRVGKSSLLYYVSHFENSLLDANTIFAFLDLQDGRYHTLSGLLNGALGQWSAKINWQPALTANNLADFSEAVRSLSQAGYRPVLCLDEFENLTKRPQEFHDDVFESWRALGNAGQLAFLTASLQPLVDLIKGGGLTSNFDNIFHQIDLALLKKPQAQTLLIEPMVRQNIDLPAGTVDEFVDYCGPHPFYLQMAGFYLFDALVEDNYTAERVQAEFARDARRHWRGLWQALGPAEQKVFPLEWVTAKPDTEKQYRRLARKGVLLAENDGYKPFSRGFAEWLREQPRTETPPEPEIEKLPEPEPESAPPPDAKPEENEETLERKQKPAPLDIKALLAAALVAVVILVVIAWVLKAILGDQSIGSLVLLLVIVFPFILVLVGKLTGQDFVSWLGQLLVKK